jgi:hypothetical protein
MNLSRSLREAYTISLTIATILKITSSVNGNFI